MRFISGLLLTILFSFIFYYFIPSWWWVAAIIAAVVGFALQMNSWLSFFCGLVTIAGLWWAMMYWQDSVNESQLSAMMANIIGVKTTGNLLLLGTIIGALLGGLGMLSGKLLRDIVSGPVKSKKSKKRKRSRYK